MKFRVLNSPGGTLNVDDILTLEACASRCGVDVTTHYRRALIDSEYTSSDGTIFEVILEAGDENDPAPGGYLE